MNPASTGSARYQLELLGPPRLAGPEGELLPRRRKELALLAWLAQRPGTAVRREQAAALFWGEKDETLARQSLRQALVKLRRTLPDAIDVTEERVVVADGIIDSDVRRFAALVEAGEAAGAIALWRGDFLEGADDAGTEPFRLWVDEERLRLRRLLQRAYERAFADATASRDAGAMLRCADQWAEALPLDTSARAARKAALEHHERAAHSRPGSAALLTPDLVGRGPALATLEEAWAACRKAGVTVVVEGDAGSGRTRLCAEFARRQRRTGTIGVVLQAQDADFLQLIAACSRLPGAAGADPSSLSALSLTGQAPRALVEAARDLIASIAEESPLFIVVDKPGPADARLGDLLASLAREPIPALLLVLTAGPEPAGQSPLARAVLDSPDARRIKLGPLRVDEATALVASMVPLADTDRMRLGSLLHRETGGVPLQLVECVSALADTGALSLDPRGRWRLAPDLEQHGLPLPATLVAARLRQLDRSARALLGAAARAGGRSDLHALAARAGLDRGDAESAVGDLVSRRLLKPVEGGGGLLEIASEQVRRAALELAPDSGEGAAARAASPWRRVRIVAAVAVLAGVAALAAAAARVPGRTGPPTHVLVLPLVNQSESPGSASLGRIASNWVAQGIGRLPGLQVAPAAEPSAEGGTDRAIRRAAAAAGAGTVIAGSYLVTGDSVTLHARIVSAADGGALATLRPVRGRSANPAPAIESLRQQVLGALGGLFDPRIAVATRTGSLAPSLGAYQAFAEGLDFLYAREGERANPALLRAYALDTTYVLPLIYAAFSYDGQGRRALVDSVLRRLGPRRAELTRYEQVTVDFLRHLNEGNTATAYDAARRAAELAPGSMMAGYYFPRAAIGLNRPREAIDALDRADPARSEIAGMPAYWSMLSMALHMAGDHERQLEVGRRVERELPHDGRGLGYQVRALAALGRIDSLEAVLARTFVLPSGPGWNAFALPLHALAFDELNAHGHGESARALLERAVRFYADAPDSLRRLPRQQLEFARALNRLGQADSAARIARALSAEPALSDELRIAFHGLLGSAAAAVGDSATAREADLWLAAQVGPWRYGRHTEYRARIAAVQGRREDAVRLLRQAVTEGLPYDNNKHIDFELSRLRGYQPYDLWLAPAGGR